MKFYSLFIVTIVEGRNSINLRLIRSQQIIFIRGSQSQPNPNRIVLFLDSKWQRKKNKSKKRCIRTVFDELKRHYNLEWEHLNNNQRKRAGHVITSSDHQISFQRDDFQWSIHLKDKDYNNWLQVPLTIILIHIKSLN